MERFFGWSSYFPRVVGRGDENKAKRGPTDLYKTLAIMHGVDMVDEYRAVVDKVSAFADAAVIRRRADITCRSGCDSCCHVWLSVSQVESEQLRTGLAALPAEKRAALAARGLREMQRETERAGPARCAMLEADGRCAVYAQRPLVCRTQGLALRYPLGFIPEASVRAKTATGEITCCPLNFVTSPPSAADVLDAERVDQLLALVNLRFANARDRDPAARQTLSELAARAATNEP
jgi:uncharacterized protein